MRRHVARPSWLSLIGQLQLLYSAAVRPARWHEWGYGPAPPVIGVADNVQLKEARQRLQRARPSPASTGMNSRFSAKPAARAATTTECPARPRPLRVVAHTRGSQWPCRRSRLNNRLARPRAQLPTIVPSPAILRHVHRCNETIRSEFPAARRMVLPQSMRADIIDQCRRDHHR